MFNNIGGKIKALAKVVTWLGILGSVISGIVMISNANSYYRTNSALIWSGLLTIVLGSLFSWLASFILYGFGELVDNSQHAADAMDQMNNRLAAQSRQTAQSAPEANPAPRLNWERGQHT